MSLQIEIIDTPNLGDRSYVVSLDGVAVVVDPQRDIDRVQAVLAAKGLTVLERNFRARAGEIDLIVRDGDTVAFVEVRARASASFGGAAASVTAAKRRRLERAARLWISARGWEGPCRFDVVAVDGGRLEHIPGAFAEGQ